MKRERERETRPQALNVLRGEPFPSTGQGLIVHYDVCFLVSSPLDGRETRGLNADAGGMKRNASRVLTSDLKADHPTHGMRAGFAFA